jgi:hypothetical protein
MNPYQDQVIGASDGRRWQLAVARRSVLAKKVPLLKLARSVAIAVTSTRVSVRAHMKSDRIKLWPILLNQGYTQAQAATMAQLQNRSSAAGNIATGAANQGNQYLSGIQAQMGAGALERGIGQAGMDASYNQQMAQYEDPFKRFASMVGSMSGTPVASQQTETKKNGLLDYMSVLAGMGSKASGGGYS